MTRSNKKLNNVLQKENEIEIMINCTVQSTVKTKTLSNSLEMNKHKSLIGT